MARTNIEWSEFSINPTMGCNIVSGGECDNCYAMKMADRLEAMGQKDYEGTTRKLKSGRVVWTGKINFDISKLKKAVKRKAPTMFFINSMSDLFHEKISFEFISECIKIMATHPQHTYQILTKRPSRLLEYSRWEAERIKESGYGDGFEFPDFIWVGVSCGTQKAADERIPILLQVPAKVRWISVEPMLEPIDLQDFLLPKAYEPIIVTEEQMKQIEKDFVPVYKISWIVAGAESGHNRRECKTEWIIDLVNQCNRFNVPPFVKQIQIGGKVIKDISQFPENLRHREYPL